jgi:hypothetical protein
LRPMAVLEVACVLSDVLPDAVREARGQRKMDSPTQWS